MSEPSLALQKALRAAMVAHGPLTALCPAASILDVNSRPEVFPTIRIGEGQTLVPEGLARRRYETFADLHIFATETGLTKAKTIAQAVRAALRDMPRSIDGHHVADLYVQQARFMRDPDGLHSHAVLTVAAVVLELT